MPSSKSQGKMTLGGQPQSDSSSGSNDSGLDDQRTRLSICDSSNTALTSLDEASGLSQPPPRNRISKLRVPHSTMSENSNMPSSSNTSCAITSTFMNDEETSDHRLGHSDEKTLTSADNLSQVQNILKALLRSASKKSDLDSMTIGDLKSELRLVSEDSSSVTCDGSFATNFNGDFSLYNNYPSRYQSYELVIVAQPEDQHRARYLTEGSRGAVKDKSGNGYPTLKLFGYSGEDPVLLQVYIGSDGKEPYPHIYYQASKVTNKNSPPCYQRIIEGTTVIEMSVPAQKDMTFSIDCVGILKERNVDVDTRIVTLQESSVDSSKYPSDPSKPMTKKKSPTCRMVFRVIIPETSGNESVKTGKSIVLQTMSELINCTQQSAGPEICRQSVSECLCNGNSELFLIGKNFSKEALVVFQNFGAPQIMPGKKDMTEDKIASAFKGDIMDAKEGVLHWMEIVIPEKDYLHANHLICQIPSLKHPEKLQIPVKIQFYVSCSDKNSNIQYLVFHPLNSKVPILISGNNIVPQGSDDTVPSIIEVQKAKLDAAAIPYNAEDLKLIPAGTKVIRTSTNEAGQPSVLLLVPTTTVPNGHNPVLPAIAPAASLQAALVTKHEQLILNQIANTSTTNINGENQVAMQPVQMMTIPPTLNVNPTSQAKPEEPFGQNVPSHIPEPNMTNHADTHDKQLKMENDLPLLTHVPNHEVLSSEPQAKYLKGMRNFPEAGVSNLEMTGGLSPQQQLINLQQEQINLQNDLEQKIFQAQNFQQQHQQMNQVLHSQVQQLAQECNNEELGRQIEIQLEQQRLQEQQVLVERDIQIQQQQQQVLERDIQIQQALQNLQREQMIEQKLDTQMRLDFENKLSPAEKQQLENGLQQIRQEQLESDLQRLQENQQLKEFQQQLTIEQNQHEKEVVRSLQQDASKTQHLRFQENQLITNVVKTPNIMSDVNKSTWVNANPLFNDSIPPAAKIDSFFFGKENPNAVDANNSGPNFINPNTPVRPNVMAFPSQMDTSFVGGATGNSCLNPKPNMFNTPFQMHPVESPTAAKMQSPLQPFLPVSSLPPNPNPNPLNFQVINGIENMDVSVPNSLLKRQSNQGIEPAAANPILNSVVFGQTQPMHGINNSTVVPMGLENNLQTTIPVMNVPEPQFMRSDAMFPQNLLANPVTGIAQPKPGATNLPPALGAGAGAGSNIFDATQQSQPLSGPSDNFLHSAILQQNVTPMVLGHVTNDSAMKNNKTGNTLMDVSMVPSDKMDTSFPVMQSTNAVGNPQDQCKMNTGGEQIIRLFEAEMMLQ